MITMLSGFDIFDERERGLVKYSLLFQKRGGAVISSYARIGCLFLEAEASNVA